MSETAGTGRNRQGCLRTGRSFPFFGLGDDFPLPKFRADDSYSISRRTPSCLRACGTGRPNGSPTRETRTKGRPLRTEVHSPPTPSSSRRIPPVGLKEGRYRVSEGRIRGPTRVSRQSPLETGPGPGLGPRSTTSGGFSPHRPR